MIETQAANAAAQAPSTSKPTRVAIQGYAGAFHEIAARYCFTGQDLEIVPAHTFKELIGKVEAQQQADFGLMAIENTLAGSLMYNYELLHQSALSVTGEVFLRIKQNLLTLPGARMEQLEEVHSHPVAIAQCRDFFAQYPHIKLVETADTALSARDVRDWGRPEIGAIASTLAAELYQLELLAESIETNKKNHTRFLVLEPRSAEDALPRMDARLAEIELAGGQPRAKVSLCFSVGHEVGSLHKVLAVLSAYNVNLTKIQSAPIIGQPWEYQFYIDFVMEGQLGHEQAIDAIRPLTHNFKLLGVYPCGLHYDH